jgi:enamine deaminase RidA (YjgF/YER057c/UK114 family)
MFKNKVVYIRPSVGGTFQEQAKSCLASIEKVLKENGSGPKKILKQSVFLGAENHRDFYTKRAEILAMLNGFYKSVTPPSSIVGQPPAGGSALLFELTLLTEQEPGVEVKLKELDGIRYVTAQYPNYKEVYGAGLTIGEKETDVLRQSQGAFELMKKILDNEGLSFGDVVRQWNYIQDITGMSAIPDGDGERQDYQVFNDTRSLYYGTADFINGYPAATGIGAGYGGIVLDFIALKDSTKLAILPVKNPEQTDAHDYSQEVLVGESVVMCTAKTTPKFERAKLLQEGDRYVVYVSGTASIRGEETVAIGDAEAQTSVTIENIEKLTAPENLIKNGAAPGMEKVNGHSLSHCRVYIKYKEDLPEVEKVCSRYYKGIPIVYLVSDVCRDNLLVEIEGAVLSG